MIAGSPNNPNNVTRTFFNTVHLLPEDLRFENEGAKLVSCPERHLTSLRPCQSWRLVPSRNPSTHFYVAKVRCRQTADLRTALAIALKLVFRFHFGGL